LIKLRRIAGDLDLGTEVEAHRDQFVYGPEPFDLDCYRRMRRMQIEQLVQPGTVNAKHSRGALVDVEYFVQALQIVHGSHDLSLRSPSTLRALTALGESGRLSIEDAATLRSAYLFFRKLIDAMRVVRGHAKDLTVPAFGTDEFVLLSRRMRATEPEALRNELEQRLRQTRSPTDRIEEYLVPPA
jgi:glutamate-ammonia-ligase adenylyltransferase